MCLILLYGASFTVNIFVSMDTRFATFPLSLSSQMDVVTGVDEWIPFLDDLIATIGKNPTTVYN